MTDHAWDVDFEHIVRRPLTALPAGEPLRPDADLGALGLDSIKAVRLLFVLEDAYGVEIPNHVLGASLFATPENLWEVVRSLGAGRDAPADDTGQPAEVEWSRADRTASGTPEERARAAAVLTGDLGDAFAGFPGSRSGTSRSARSPHRPVFTGPGTPPP